MSTNLCNFHRRPLGPEQGQIDVITIIGIEKQGFKLVTQDEVFNQYFQLSGHLLYKVQKALRSLFLNSLLCSWDLGIGHLSLGHRVLRSIIVSAMSLPRVAMALSRVRLLSLVSVPLALGLLGLGLGLLTTVAFAMVNAICVARHRRGCRRRGLQERKAEKVSFFFPSGFKACEVSLLDQRLTATGTGAAAACAGS